MHSATRSGRLRPAELAEAVVLADLSLALTVVGQVVPFGGALLVTAVVPLAVVSARHRLRAVVAGAVAAAAVGFLVIGTAALTTMAACAAFGALVGAADRRGWGRGRTMIYGTAMLWPPIAIITDVLLLIFANLRKLTLDQVRNSWKGLFHLLSNIGLTGIGDAGTNAVTWIVDYWYISIPIFLFVAVVFGIWLAQGLSTPTLRRVRNAFGDHRASIRSNDVAPETDTPAALPVSLRDVSFRYPNAPVDALHDVSVRIDRGEMVAIVGRNGSGKSTLARIVAGRYAPATGTIERPGAVGLGQVGGTAFVFQRPEAQVLGVRVRDDVVWGLHDPAAVDVDAALARVGLSELADRETSTLSGGELQRLAVAAAIARHPQLLVSDEATSMVDAGGRTGLIALLRDLTRDGVGVVHVSHYASEADAADRKLVLDGGNVVPADAPSAVERSTRMSPRGMGRAQTWKKPGPLIELRGVGHVYSRGTPWANRALEDVNLTIDEGESVLVIGHNGSGKSTLAWIIAGLLVPTEGDALVDHEHIADHIGRVGLSFQHARLQLLRPIVLDDVKTAAGVDEGAARRALYDVGLDREIADRRVDELSGGQMRRVVLAAVIAARPRAIVLDEPFAGLDTDGRADLEAVLVRLRDEHDIALIIVSHDHDLPSGLVVREVELERGRVVRDTRIIEVGEPS
jgi:energy-coupling factor transport system ATP-binding protein